MLEALIEVLKDVGRYALSHPDIAEALAFDVVRLIRGNPSGGDAAMAGMIEGMARIRAEAATTAIMRERRMGPK